MWKLEAVAKMDEGEGVRALNAFGDLFRVWMDGACT